MRKFAAFAFIVATPAFAQQATPADPPLAVCQQLLSGANANLIQQAAQAITLSRQLDDAKAELAKLKPAEK